LLHVPYRGAAPALTDLLGGQVLAMFADTPVLLPHIRAGKLKPIGAASAERNPMLADVSTLAEQGFPDTVADNWYGLLAPAHSSRSPRSGARWRRGTSRRPPGRRNCTTRSSPCSMRPTYARSSFSPAPHRRRCRARNLANS